MNYFKFTEKAKLQFIQLDQEIQARILNKLSFLKTHPKIFSSLVVVKNLDYSTHRLRVGNYRLLLRLSNQDKEVTEFLILKIGHRREIYQ